MASRQCIFKSILIRLKINTFSFLELTNDNTFIVTVLTPHIVKIPLPRRVLPGRNIPFTDQVNDTARAFRLNTQDNKGEHPVRERAKSSDRDPIERTSTISLLRCGCRRRKPAEVCVILRDHCASQHRWPFATTTNRRRNVCGGKHTDRPQKRRERKNRTHRTRYYYYYYTCLIMHATVLG